MDRREGAGGQRHARSRQTIVPLTRLPSNPRMRANKIILAVHVLDNADVLRDYLEWYRQLGVDLVVANDFGSTDGGQDILEDFAKQDFVRWSYQASKKAKDTTHPIG